MKTWKVVSEGESWTVDAPDDVTEAEVNEFAAANYASWVNGGHYRMDPVGVPAAMPALTEPPGPSKQHLGLKMDAPALSRGRDRARPAIRGTGHRLLQIWLQE